MLNERVELLTSSVSCVSLYLVHLCPRVERGLGAREFVHVYVRVRHVRACVCVSVLACTRYADLSLWHRTCRGNCSFFPCETVLADECTPALAPTCVRACGACVCM